MPEGDRIGADGQGFKIVLHGLNPERALDSRGAIGIGRVAIARAARYARERDVFNRPIGMSQGIQHPLAKCWPQLEAVRRFAFEACHTAMLTLGGMGDAQEHPVDR